MNQGTIQRTPALAMRPPAHAAEPATLDGCTSRRNTVMKALLRSAGVTHGYQSDSSSKQPTSSAAFARRACVTRSRPPPGGTAHWTGVAPYQLDANPSAAIGAVRQRVGRPRGSEGGVGDALPPVGCGMAMGGPGLVIRAKHRRSGWAVDGRRWLLRPGSRAAQHGLMGRALDLRLLASLRLLSRSLAPCCLLPLRLLASRGLLPSRFPAPGLLAPRLLAPGHRLPRPIPTVAAGFVGREGRAPMHLAARRAGDEQVEPPRRDSVVEAAASHGLRSSWSVRAHRHLPPAGTVRRVRPPGLGRAGGPGRIGDWFAASTFRRARAERSDTFRCRDAPGATCSIGIIVVHCAYLPVRNEVEGVERREWRREPPWPALSLPTRRRSAAAHAPISP
jgi:hypothetical protein